MARAKQNKHEDDDVDGCACGHGIGVEEITSDVDLPAARGGVEPNAAPLSVRPRRRIR